MSGERLDDALLTPRQAADYCQVSVRTLRRWIADRRLPTLRAGRQVRIQSSALLRFLGIAVEDERGGSDAEPAENDDLE